MLLLAGKNQNQTKKKFHERKKEQKQPFQQRNKTEAAINFIAEGEILTTRKQILQEGEIKFKTAVSLIKQKPIQITVEEFRGRVRLTSSTTCGEEIKN